MTIKKFLQAVVVLAACGIAATYAFDKPDVTEYTSADSDYAIAPNEKPELMREVEQLQIYKLTDGKNCTGLVIADKKLKMYQRLIDISCDQPKVTSVSVSPLELPDLVAVSFYHNDVLVGRITLIRGDIKNEMQ
ncbi:TPA: hypothetical protein NU463_004317 [Escherichia coli]|nr:hypothetical protein [Escherichia coli]